MRSLSRLLRFACAVAPLAGFTGCDAAGPDDSEARPIPISQFKAARFWGVPIGSGQVELSYHENAAAALTPSTEVYPYRQSAFTVVRGAGDSLNVSGIVYAEGTTEICQLQFDGVFHASVLDGRPLPTDLSGGPAGVAQLNPTCSRSGTYWGVPTGFEPTTTRSVRITFVPTADSAGLLEVDFEQSATVLFSEQIPDTALTYRLFARGEFEKRRDGSLYSGGAYVRGGPNDPGSTPTSPTVPAPPGSIKCPSPPAGYKCVERNGLDVPLKLEPAGVLRAWYHSASFKTCIGLGVQEPRAFAAYRSGPGYEGEPITGLGDWGAPVSSDGVITGSADGRYIYIYTGHPDSQVAMLLYDLDPQAKNFVTMGFQRVATCPY